ncbi:hypothetical protein RHGRI_028271 [Rhododendron griersonianum]|uniref:RNA helicase n=1 Tax=Rhododendron griersonianum TaxID=479676 RepID=A0AAV6IFK4_9ERIC|nr:hypothetical protein RHGRI_028271 [Rhododendron griersonianum]
MSRWHCSLLDIDILKFDFLDPPSTESLEDALKQLYLIDAIDENGSITSIGQTMAELPLEPSLSRTLIDANEYGCLSQALTVAAMLSAETSLLPGRSKSTDKKRKCEPSDLPDGSGWGDHIQLLQIYELWDQANYDVEWCKDNNLQTRGMKFVKEVRKQLSQIMQKIAKGSLDVRTNGRRKESQEDYRNLRKCLCMGYANQLAERMMRHNGYWTLGFKPQLVQVHPSSVLKTDEEGMLPNYVVYHELISTSRPFLRDLCTVERQWVMPILKKLEKLNINKLSGGTVRSEEQTKGENPSSPEKEVGVARPPDDSQSMCFQKAMLLLPPFRFSFYCFSSHSTLTSSFPCQAAQSAPVVVSGAPTGLASFQSMVIGFVGVCILFFVFNEFV